MHRLLFLAALGGAPISAIAQLPAPPPTGTIAEIDDTVAARALDYWRQHARDGTMNRADAAAYRSAEGRPVDLRRLDSDADGRISQSEWMDYHGGSRADEAARRRDTRGKPREGR